MRESSQTDLSIDRKLRKDDLVISLDEFFYDQEYNNWIDDDWLCWANDTHKFYNFVDIHKTREEIPEGATQIYFAPK